MKAVIFDQVGKSFGENHLYKDVSFTIEEGECIGFVGANGSGKSVLYLMLCGLEGASQGEIRVFDHIVGPDKALPKDMGLLVNQPGYIGHLTGLDNLMLLGDINDHGDKAKISEVMERVGLDPNNKTKVKNYSTGMKQKLGIAQAIMEDQRIILLDEPFNGLDFESTKEVLDILRSIKASGKTLILTSHQQIFLDEICDRMFLITKQQVMELTDELKEKYFSVKSKSDLGV